MNPKDDLEAALRSSAAAATPAPDRSFVDALEQRLMTADADGRVIPLVRRARRLGVAATAAIVLTVAGAAAAAGIVVTHPFTDDSPDVAPTATEATTAVPSAIETTVQTTTPAASVGTSTTAPSAVVATNVVPSTTAAPATTAPPATVPVTVAPTVPPTVPPTTAAPVTTTTEVHTPVSLTISCSATGTTVQCRWSGTVPAGGATYAILRGDLTTGGPGRVFFVPLGTTTWTDPMAVAGVQYSYLVHVFDASNHSLGHSNAAIVNCC